MIASAYVGAALSPRICFSGTLWNISTTSAIIEILHHFYYHRCLFKQRIRIVNLDSEVSDRF